MFCHYISSTFRITNYLFIYIFVRYFLLFFIGYVMTRVTHTYNSRVAIFFSNFSVDHVPINLKIAHLNFEIKPYYRHLLIVLIIYNVTVYMHHRCITTWLGISPPEFSDHQGQQIFLVIADRHTNTYKLLFYQFRYVQEK